MNVGVDHELNANPSCFRHAQIRFDRADGIDHGTGSAAAATEEIGDADGVLMQELTKDHGLVLLISTG